MQAQGSLPNPITSSYHRRLYFKSAERLLANIRESHSHHGCLNCLHLLCCFPVTTLATC